MGCHYLWIASLPIQYAINALLDKQHSKQVKPHHMAISQLTSKQNQKIKSLIVNINHHLNQVLPAFDNLNKELSPGFHLVDIFSDYFSFNIVKHKDAKARIAYLKHLQSLKKQSRHPLHYNSDGDQRELITKQK